MKHEQRDKKTKRQRDEVRTNRISFLQLATRNSQLATSRPAFTLTELLVVIGIIIILVGILLPVVAKIRMSAYSADTQNEIDQISAACGQYYATFHGYPGPFSNDDIGGGTARTQGNGGSGAPGGPTSLAALYFATGGAAPAYTALNNTPWAVTGAQNLVLGLMGGLRPVPGTGPGTATPITQLAFAPADVGLGPMSLNSANPTRTPSFFSTGSNYLMWCQTNSNNQVQQTTGAYQSLVAGTFTGVVFTDAAGTQAADCALPVFVDRFPAPGPLPILYLRARTGAKGIIWDNSNVSTDTNGIAPADYQYDMRDIYPYTQTHIGLAPLDKTGAANTHNLCGIQTFPSQAPGMESPTSVLSNSSAPHPQQINNCGAYFTNTSIAPTGSDPNYYGRPRAVDQFILISAGPDGVYGTSDDLTSFGSVSN